MELFHCPFSRAFRVLWLLNELDLKHDLNVLEYPPRASKAFRQMNRLATVPFLRDDGHEMVESTAILIYLSAKAGVGNLALAPDENEYPEWLDWIAFGETSLAGPLSMMLHYNGSFEFDPFMPVPEKLENVIDYFTDRFRVGIEHVAERLIGRSYLVGDRFSASDISVGYTFRLAEAIGAGDMLRPVLPYWERLQRRDGYQKALSEEQAAAVVTG